MLRDIDNEIYIDKSIMSKPKKDFKPRAPGMKYGVIRPKASSENYIWRHR